MWILLLWWPVCVAAPHPLCEILPPSTAQHHGDLDEPPVFQLNGCTQCMHLNDPLVTNHAGSPRRVGKDNDNATQAPINANDDSEEETDHGWSDEEEWRDAVAEAAVAAQMEGARNYTPEPEAGTLPPPEQLTTFTHYGLEVTLKEDGVGSFLTDNQILKLY